MAPASNLRQSHRSRAVTPSPLPSPVRRRWDGGETVAVLKRMCKGPRFFFFFLVWYCNRMRGTLRSPSDARGLVLCRVAARKALEACVGAPSSLTAMKGCDVMIRRSASLLRSATCWLFVCVLRSHLRVQLIGIHTLV